MREIGVKKEVVYLVLQSRKSDKKTRQENKNIRVKQSEISRKEEKNN
jgi:hypothetical protein